jgi:methyltransferase (TIGR00027 family)
VHERRPSKTAAFVAFARALADEGFTTVQGFHDPLAKELLPPSWSILRATFGRLAAGRNPAALGELLQNLDPIPLRVLAIDDELTAAIAAGCRQLVILGAGLDTRAHRMHALADVDVFEVDHPQSQAYKQRKAAALPKLAGALTYVAVDFERHDLAERLRAAGHRPEVPTVWIWEGVVMYLTDDALRATLSAVADSSAPGSILICHYHEASLAPAPIRIAEELLLSFWREPQIGRRTRAAMAEEVERAGLVVLRDSEAAEWAERYGAAAATSDLARATRMLVARRAEVA